MSDLTPADDLPVAEQFDEPAEVVELGDDGEAGALAAAEVANYIRAQSDYRPIAEGE